jgi:hypothetical protein
MMRRRLHSLPLLVMLRKQRNHHYYFESVPSAFSSTKISSSPLLGRHQTLLKLGSSPPSQSNRPDSFQKLMQQLKENQRDILRENVRYLVNGVFVRHFFNQIVSVFVLFLFFNITQTHTHTSTVFDLRENFCFLYKMTY